VITPLDGSAAVGTGTLAGSLVIRHVFHEAEQVNGAIVTRAPWQYPTGDIPIRPV